MLILSLLSLIVDFWNNLWHLRGLHSVEKVLSGFWMHVKEMPDTKPKGVTRKWSKELSLLNLNEKYILKIAVGLLAHLNNLKILTFRLSEQKFGSSCLLWAIPILRYICTVLGKFKNSVFIDRLFSTFCNYYSSEEAVLDHFW